MGHQQRNSNAVMDFFGRVWLAMGDAMQVRPATIIGLIAGSIIFASALTFSIVKTKDNTTKIREIQAAFCNGDMAYDERQRENCQKLLDQLLKKPTPEQARRLREIIRSTR